MSPLRERLLGGGLLFAFLCVLAGGLGRLIPDGSPLSPVPRLTENLSPHLLLLALLTCLLCIRGGARRSGLVLATLVLLTGAGVGYRYMQDSLPTVAALEPGEQDLRILFFNVLASNGTNADRIAQMVLDIDPDIAVFAESEGISPAFDTLRAHFAFAPCQDYKQCDLSVFARMVPEKYEFRPLSSFTRTRIFRGTFDWHGQEFTLYGAHLLKPWFSGFAEADRQYLHWFTARSRGPALMVGDFNMPLWTHAMSDLLQRTGFKAERRPLASWPAAMGPLGVPIDHALVRGGARLVSVKPVGGDMGSNHRGLLITLRLGQGGD